LIDKVFNDKTQKALEIVEILKIYAKTESKNVIEANYSPKKWEMGFRAIESALVKN